MTREELEALAKSHAIGLWKSKDYDFACDGRGRTLKDLRDWISSIKDLPDDADIFTMFEGIQIPISVLKTDEELTNEIARQEKCVKNERNNRYIQLQKLKEEFGE
jgi:hypothetical protein